MGTVECFVCKAEGKKKFVFDVEDADVGDMVNCAFCSRQFVLVKRNGKLFLDYPDVAEDELVDSTNFDNLGDSGGKSL